MCANPSLDGPRFSTQAELIAALPKHLQAFDVAPDGCWIAHKRRSNGYAWSTSYGGRNGLKGAAYRILYQLLIGPVPAGLDLDHYVCDNGPGGCCNPFHCRIATRGENVLRGQSPHARNARATHCVNGHEFTPENTLAHTNGNYGRKCRICTYERHQAYLERTGKEEFNRKRRDHYQRNRERILAQKKEWRARRSEAS